MCHEKAHGGPHEVYIQLMQIHKASRMRTWDLNCFVKHQKSSILCKSFAIQKAYTLSQKNKQDWICLCAFFRSDTLHASVPFIWGKKSNKEGSQVSSTNLLFCVNERRIFAQYSQLVYFCLSFKINGSTKGFPSWKLGIKKLWLQLHWLDFHRCNAIHSESYLDPHYCISGHLTWIFSLFVKQNWMYAVTLQSMHLVVL